MEATSSPCPTIAMHPTLELWFCRKLSLGKLRDDVANHGQQTAWGRHDQHRRGSRC